MRKMYIFDCNTSFPTEMIKIDPVRIRATDQVNVMVHEAVRGSLFLGRK